VCFHIVFSVYREKSKKHCVFVWKMKKVSRADFPKTENNVFVFPYDKVKHGVSFFKIRLETQCFLCQKSAYLYPRMYY